MKRYFFAHPYAMEDGEIDDHVQFYQAWLDKKLPGGGTQVIAGRDDFNANARALGGFRGWPSAVATGTIMGGDARFHCFIVPGRHVGKATAEIVQKALAAGKSVALWQKDGRPSQVSSIQRVSSCPKTGWALQ